MLSVPVTSRGAATSVEFGLALVRQALMPDQNPMDRPPLPQLAPTADVPMPASSVIKGKVVAVEKEFAVIDVGLKTEGKIPLKEFGLPGQPNKIAVAMMKAFLAVHGTQGAASASVRETVDQLTQAVVRALMRSRPGGGTQNSIR